jgi:hypothetical protein
MVNELGRRTPALAFLLATMIAFAVIIVGALVLLGDGLPAQALAVMGGAGAMALVWGIMLMATERREARSQSAAPVLTDTPVSLLLETTSLEMLQAMPAPSVPITVAVTNAVGVCPRGLTVGDTVSINARGHLTRPLCRTAVEALQASLLDPKVARDFDRRVSCYCPVAGPGLTFAVRPAGARGLD